MIDYQAFHRAALHWIDVLGLTDWAIDINMQPLNTPEDDAVVARTWINWTQRAARIVVNSNHRWTPNSTEATFSGNPERTALHEVLHIAINPLANVCAESRDSTGPIPDAEEHALIRKLMRAMPVPVFDEIPDHK